MPRDENGNQTSPNAPVDAGSTILSSVYNSNEDDSNAELTDSLSRSGKGGMLAQLKAIDGSAAAPGVSFLNELSSGLFRHSAGDIRAAVSGLAGLILEANKTNGVRVGKVDKDGSLSALIADIGPTITHLLLYPEPWDVPANLTIPENITLDLPRGVDFNIASGKILTMPQPLAGRYRLFSGDGTPVFNKGCQLFPEWFDGVGQTAGAQAAIDAANASGGGDVIVDSESFTWGDGTLGGSVALKSNVRLIGSGYASQIISAAGSSGIKISDISNFSIRNLRFTGPGFSWTGSKGGAGALDMGTISGGHGIYCQSVSGGSHDGIIDGCYIEDYEENGIRFNSDGDPANWNSDIRITNNKIGNCAKIGIATNSSERMVIAGNQLDSFGQGCIQPAGIYILTGTVPGGSSNMSLGDFVTGAISGATGYVTSGSATEVTLIKVTGQFRAETITAQDANEFTVASVSDTRGNEQVITGNTCRRGNYINTSLYSSTNAGIDIEEGEDIAVSGNVIVDSLSNGISIYGAGAAVAGNVVVDSDEVGIATLYPDSDPTISGNQIRRCGGNGIQVSGRLMTVSNNVVYEADKGIFINGQDCLIVGNTVARSSLDGIQIEGTRCVVSNSIVKESGVNGSNRSGVFIGTAVDCDISHNQVYGSTNAPIGFKIGTSLTGKSVMIGNRSFNCTSGDELGTVANTLQILHPDTEELLAPGYRSGRELTMADDTAISFTPPALAGTIEVHGFSSGVHYHVLAGYRTTSSVTVTKITGTAGGEVTTGALTGTTGIDTKMTVSAHTDGKIYIENRIGGAMNIVWSIMSG